MKKLFLPIALLLTVALLFSTFSLIGCGGGGSGGSSAPGGVNDGMPSIIELNAVQSIVHTNSYLYFKAKVLDGNGNIMPGTPVIFTNLTALGVLSSTTVNTDNRGFATVSLYSTTSGFATVQAEVRTGTGLIRTKKTIFFSDTGLTLPGVTGAATALGLEADANDNGVWNETSDLTLFETTADNQFIIRATLAVGGSRVAGAAITFGSDSTEATFPLLDSANPVVYTDANGQASTLVVVNPAFLRDISTVLNITASSDNPSAGNLLSFIVNPITVNKLVVTAAPTTIDLDGTATITADVTTSAGAPVPDDTTVNFTTTLGSVEPFAQTTNGRAEAAFTAPSVGGVAKITATVGGMSGTVSVTINVPVPSATPAPSPTPTPTPAPTTLVPATYAVAGGDAVADNLVFSVSGGTAPYIANSSCVIATTCNSTVSADSDCADATDTNVWNVAASGGTFTVTVPTGAPVGNCTITVTDSLGVADTAVISIL